jgi:uncharacterized coiled-coil protein SlyX
MSEENIVTGEGFMDDWDYEYQKRIAELEAQLAEKDAEIARLNRSMGEAISERDEIIDEQEAEKRLGVSYE